MPQWPHYVSNEQSYTGNQALCFPFEPVLDGGTPTGHMWSERRFNLGRQLTELWIEYWFRLPDNWRLPYGGSGYNNKFLALWAEQYSISGDFCFILEFGRSPAWGDEGTFTTVATARPTVKAENFSGMPTMPGYINNNFLNASWAGEWKRFRFHIRLASGPGMTDGIVEGWMGEDLAFRSAPDLVIREPNGAQLNYISRGYLMGADNTWSAERMEYFIDDIKFYDQYPGWGE